MQNIVTKIKILTLSQVLFFLRSLCKYLINIDFFINILYIHKSLK